MYFQNKIFFQAVFAILFISGCLFSVADVFAGSCGSLDDGVGTSHCTDVEPWSADSTSYADVNYCVNTCASETETVNIPAGEATWSSRLVISKNIKLIGAGSDATLITCTSGGSTAFINITPSISGFFRLSGFSFNGQNTNSGLVAGYSSKPDYTEIRIDHNSFLNFRLQSPTLPWVVSGSFKGVVDNNLFTGYPHFDNYGGGGGGYSWNNFVYVPGDPNLLYYEENTIITQNTTTVWANGSGGQGRGWAFRYNDFIDETDWSAYPIIDNHGNQATGVYSSMGDELYGNEIFFGAFNGHSKNAEVNDNRGGSGFRFFNNLAKGYYATTAQFTIREEYPDTNCLTDHLCPEESGYLYGGTYTCSSNGQPQHVSNAYYWNNRLDSNGSTINVQISTDVSWANGLVENIHFWDYNESYNGITEIGVGCGSVLPANCTVGDGYWLTTQGNCSDLTGFVGANPQTPISGTLHKCTSTDTWEEYYKPYVYPHPLRRQFRSDLDVDDDVDIFDYNILIGNFGVTNDCNKPDADLDCDVDIFDYSILLGEFGSGT